MNFGAMQTQVQVVLGDENEAVVTKANIKVWLNQAYRELARRVGGVLTSSSVTSINADKTYTFPTTLIAIERILWAGNPLWPNHWNSIRNFTIPTGTPYSYYTKGPSVVGFYPEPTVNTGLSITFDYRHIPADLSGDSDVVTLPDLASDAMIEYALERGYRLTNQLELVGVARAAFEEKVSSLLGDVSSNADSLAYPQIQYVGSSFIDESGSWQF